jgi:deoxyribonuclease V
VAGVDISVKNKTARAAVVVLGYSDMARLEVSVAEQPVSFPYVPGLLSFRECPSILEAIKGISLKPDLILVDGQGLAHPRRFGLACHLGVLLDPPTPTIGCAKTRFIGTYDEPDLEAGSFSHLFDGDEVIGAVVRTRTRVKPLFVSIGHKIDLPSAIAHVLGCCTRTVTRLYEPPLNEWVVGSWLLVLGCWFLVVGSWLPEGVAGVFPKTNDQLLKTNNHTLITRPHSESYVETVRRHPRRPHPDAALRAAAKQVTPSLRHFVTP